MPSAYVSMPLDRSVLGLRVSSNDGAAPAVTCAYSSARGACQGATAPTSRFCPLHMCPAAGCTASKPSTAQRCNIHAAEEAAPPPPCADFSPPPLTRSRSLSSWLGGVDEHAAPGSQATVHSTVLLPDGTQYETVVTEDVQELQRRLRYLLSGQEGLQQRSSMGVNRNTVADALEAQAASEAAAEGYPQRPPQPAVAIQPESGATGPSDRGAPPSKPSESRNAEPPAGPSQQPGLGHGGGFDGAAARYQFSNANAGAAGGEREHHDSRQPQRRTGAAQKPMEMVISMADQNNAELTDGGGARANVPTNRSNKRIYDIGGYDKSVPSE